MAVTKAYAVTYDYFKPDTGKWYTNYRVLADRSSIIELHEEVISELVSDVVWPGLSTRGNFDVVVTIQAMNDFESLTFLYKEPRP
jgi:CO dehydrogenase/acetyl-CoA synthase epsilon subunit